MGGGLQAGEQAGGVAGEGRPGFGCGAHLSSVPRLVPRRAGDQCGVCFLIKPTQGIYCNLVMTQGSSKQHEQVFQELLPIKGAKKPASQNPMPPSQKLASR